MQNIKNHSQENQHRKIKHISSDCIGKEKKKRKDCWAEIENRTDKYWNKPQRCLIEIIITIIIQKKQQEALFWNVKPCCRYLRMDYPPSKKRIEKQDFLKVLWMHVSFILAFCSVWFSKYSIPREAPCNITPAQVKATRGATACCDAGCRHAVWSLCHHCAWIYLLVPFCFQLTRCSHCLCLFPQTGAAGGRVATTQDNFISVFVIMGDGRFIASNQFVPLVY